MQKCKFSIYLLPNIFLESRRIYINGGLLGISIGHFFATRSCIDFYWRKASACFYWPHPWSVRLSLRRLKDFGCVWSTKVLSSGSFYWSYSYWARYDSTFEVSVCHWWSSLPFYLCLTSWAWLWNDADWSSLGSICLTWTLGSIFSLAALWYLPILGLFWFNLWCHLFLPFSSTDPLHLFFQGFPNQKVRWSHDRRYFFPGTNRWTATFKIPPWWRSRDPLRDPSSWWSFPSVFYDTSSSFFRWSYYSPPPLEDWSCSSSLRCLSLAWADPLLSITWALTESYTLHCFGIPSKGYHRCSVLPSLFILWKILKL